MSFEVSHSLIPYTRVGINLLRTSVRTQRVGFLREGHSNRLGIRRILVTYYTVCLAALTLTIGETKYEAEGSAKKTKYSPRLKYTIRNRRHLVQDPLIFDGIRQIAKKEKKSVSRIVEEILIDWFNFPTSVYRDIKRSKSGE